MSFDPVIAPADGAGGRRSSKGKLTLAKQIRDASLFLQGLRQQMRLGELTRNSLRLLRFQVSEELVECDWVAREADPWDADLPGGVGQHHASLQALKDAIDIRNLLFSTQPEVNLALFRVYRAGPGYDELIITGTSERSDQHTPSVRSLAMRAQLLGFRFSMDNGILNELRPDARSRVGT